jgi:glycosyltransferase involved in cell wall biosynthesis
MFSIIIPTKNEEKMIEEAIRQFKALHKKHEVIVYDGISTDNTVKLAKKHTRKVFVQKEKKITIAKARNCGAKHAKGDIFLFLDADVRIPDINHFFERIEQVFQDKSVAAATMPIFIYPEEETRQDRFYHNLLNRVAYAEKGGRGECQIIRKAAFKKAGGYKEYLVAGEDFEMYSRLKKIGRIAYLWDLLALESPRRFRKLGYIRLYILYTLNSICVKLFDRAFSKEWTPIR